jgi:glycosyltransferase involved in cell wall biosynthesis
VSVPLVSIIIPCYNAEPWLAETLESALAQSWPAKEIILVDDGSTDRSRTIARRYSAAGVIVLEQQNRGASAARNAALAHARGDFIQYLDADDLLAPDKIECQLATPGTTKLTLLSGCWQRFRAAPGDMPAIPERLCCDSAPTEWVSLKLSTNSMMHPAAWLVSRELTQRSGFWDERISLDDDGEYFTRVALASDRIQCCFAALSYYRSQIPSSLSGRKSDAAWNSAFLSLELSVGRLLTLNNTAATRGAAAAAFQRFIYESYPAAKSARRRAAATIETLGGTDLQPEGGPKFQALRRLVGWRIAKRLQRAQ